MTKAKTRKKTKRGRRGLYHKWREPANLELLRGWKRRGLTDEQIAKNMGIATGTLYAWKNKYNDIDEALKKGRDAAITELENATFKAALGYEYEETKTYITVDKNGNESRRIEKQTKHAQPNGSLAIFILRNMGRPSWSNKPEHEEQIRLQNKKIQAELELLELQKERLSPTSESPFTALLKDLLMSSAEDAELDEEEEEEEADE